MTLSLDLTLIDDLALPLTLTLHLTLLDEIKEEPHHCPLDHAEPCLTLLGEIREEPKPHNGFFGKNIYN